MIQLAYLFERFPSFTQTFCYREVRELRRQGFAPSVFSIRQPANEPPEHWDPELVRQVHYLPEEKQLLEEVERTIRKKKIPDQAVTAFRQWGRQTDFLRLYQAAYIGMRLPRGVCLHAHFAGMAARTAYWIKQFFGIAFSFTAHANDIFVSRAFVVDLDRLVDSARFVVTESDYAAGFLQRRFPECANKVHRVYNGLDLSSFPRADLATPIPLIISIGRLIEKKGFADLIEACRLLAASNNEFRCEIIGEGPLENALREQVERSGLEGKISLLGAQTQEEIKKRLAAATVFALPCTTEATGGTDNLPTVIMEAMAASLPVVSTAIAGVPEMVQDGVTGELVSPNDPRAVAHAIAKFLSNRQRARDFGSRGLQLAQKKFAIETSVRALLELFRNSPL